MQIRCKWQKLAPLQERRGPSSSSARSRLVAARPGRPVHAAAGCANARRTSSPDFPRIRMGNLRFVLHEFAQCLSALALKSLRFQRCFGTGEGIRTLDPNLGKVVLPNSSTPPLSSHQCTLNGSRRLRSASPASTIALARTKRQVSSSPAKSTAAFSIPHAARRHWYSEKVLFAFEISKGTGSIDL